MKKVLILLAFLSLPELLQAQGSSSTWIDVTTQAYPYNVQNDCSADAGPGINYAIASVPSGQGGAVFFPTDAT